MLFKNRFNLVILWQPSVYSFFLYPWNFL